MKIFVTGATGFIGSYFVNHALSQGAQVWAHRRSIHSQPAVPFRGEVNWVTKNLEELSSEDLKDMTACVHFAACGVTPKPATWDECFRFNALESLRLLEKCDNAGCKRFVAAGSYAEYGKAGLRFDPIPPDAPLEPTDPYAASKAASGVALAAYARSHAIQLYYGRIFSAYGEGQSSSNFWPQLRDAAISGKDFPMTAGEQVRDFIRVEDVAARFYHACIREDLAPSEPMFRNVGSGEPVSLKDFALQTWQTFRATGQILAGAIPYRSHEVMRYVPMIQD